MAAHDPLCLLYPSQHAHTETMCSCGLIALVRADERAAIMRRVAQNMTVDREKWTVLARSLSAHRIRADLREAVEALPSMGDPDWDETRQFVWKDEVLALLDGGAPC